MGRVAQLNDACGVYVEPFAGGAGAALSLLMREQVNRVLINDADPRVHAFWMACLSKTREFLGLIESVPLTVAEWRRQRAIYQRPEGHPELHVGFATFFLNRCNRSGIIGNGGPIGGISQQGQWKIDARFNRAALVHRVQRVASYRDRIQVSNLDALVFLRERVQPLPPEEHAFVYLDPPYFKKAEDLYLNHYRPKDHAAVAAYVKRNLRQPWVMSYDDQPEIRRLYADLRHLKFELDYTAYSRRAGRELLIVKDGLALPKEWRRTIPASELGAAA